MKLILEKVKIGSRMNNMFLKGGSWLVYNTDMELVKVYTEPKPMYEENTNSVTWEECYSLTIDERGNFKEGLTPFDHVPNEVYKDFDKVIEKRGFIVVD